MERKGNEKKERYDIVVYFHFVLQKETNKEVQGTFKDYFFIFTVCQNFIVKLIQTI